MYRHRSTTWSTRGSRTSGLACGARGTSYSRKSSRRTPARSGGYAKCWGRFCRRFSTLKCDPLRTWKRNKWFWFLFQPWTRHFFFCAKKCLCKWESVVMWLTYLPLRPFCYPAHSSATVTFPSRRWCSKRRLVPRNNPTNSFALRNRPRVTKFKLKFRTFFLGFCGLYLTLFGHFMAIFEILGVLATCRHLKIQNRIKIDQATSQNVKVYKKLFGQLFTI